MKKMILLTGRILLLLLLVFSITTNLFANPKEDFTPLPYFMGFEEGEDYSLMTVVNNKPDDNRTWTRVKLEGNKAPASMKYQGISKVADDYLFTPKFSFEAGKTYRVRFFVKKSNANNQEKLSLSVSNGITIESIIEELWKDESLNAIHTEYEVNYLCETTGEHHFVWHAYSDRYKGNIFMDDIVVSEVPVVDAAIQKIYGPQNIMQGKEFNYNVLVKNDGQNAITSYTIKLIDSDDNELATVTQTGTLEAGETILVPVPCTPLKAYEGTLRAKVLVDNDGNDFNNYSYEVPLNVSEHSSYLTEKIGTYSGINASYMPFNFYYRSGVAQTIYFQHEIGIEGYITHITYNYNFENNLKEKAVKVWMANTELNQLDGWIPESEFTLVYDGTIELEKGISDVTIKLDEKFKYTGKNLVIMTGRSIDTPHSSMNRFYFDDTPEFLKRTYYYYSSTTEFDGTQAGNYSTYFPVIYLDMIVESGTVSGTVISEHGAPLEGAKIEVEGTDFVAYTDQQGDYNLDIVPAGTQNIKALKQGYIDAVVEEEIQHKQNSVVDFTMYDLILCNVKGTVIASDTQEPIEGASVSLSGYNDHSTLTDSEGKFTIENVFGGNRTYQFEVRFPDYATYSATIELESADWEQDITLLQYAFSPYNVKAEIEDDNVIVRWQKGNEDVEFRYDSGTYSGVMMTPLNPTEYSITGAAFHYNAHVSEVLWYTIEECPFVNVFIFDLDEEGKPTHDILYSKFNVPNTHGQWTTMQLEETLEAPNGFMLALSSSDSQSVCRIGMTKEQLPDYPYLIGTQYLNADYRNSHFYSLEFSETVTYRYNYMIRAKGASFGSTDNHPAKTARVASLDDFSVYRLVDGQDRESWTLLGTATDTEFIDTDWNNINPNIYRYAVEANFPNGVVSRPEISNQVLNRMNLMVNVNLSTNSNESPDESQLRLTNEDDPSRVYYAEAWGNPVEFPSVWRGDNYTLEVYLADYKMYKQTGISIQEDGLTINAELEEIIYPPYGLQAEVDNDKATLTWNNIPDPFFDDMENYSPFIIENIGEYTLYDGDGLKTRPIAEASFPNEEYIGSFMVMNPYRFKGDNGQPIEIPYQHYLPLDEEEGGEQYLACINTVEGANDDWIIMPKQKVVPNMVFRFACKSYWVFYGHERIRVGISTTGTNPEDFHFIDDPYWIPNVTPPVKGVPDQWGIRTINLTEYQGQEVYLAINCISEDTRMLFIDNIYIGVPEKKVIKPSVTYTVYLDGAEHASGLKKTNCNFSNLSAGEHTLGVQAVFPTTNTNIEYITVNVSPVGITPVGSHIEIHPNPTSENLWVTSSDPVKNILVNDAGGATTLSVSGLNTNEYRIDVSTWAKGIYIIHVATDKGTKTNKFIVR